VSSNPDIMSIDQF